MSDILPGIILKFRRIYGELGSEEFLTRCAAERTREPLETFLREKFAPFLRLLGQGKYEEALSCQKKFIDSLRNTKWHAKVNGTITGAIMGKAGELIGLFQELESEVRYPYPEPLTEAEEDAVKESNFGPSVESLEQLSSSNAPVSMNSASDFIIKLDEAERSVELEVKARNVKPGDVMWVYYQNICKLMSDARENYKNFQLHRQQLDNRKRSNGNVNGLLR